MNPPKLAQLRARILAIDEDILRLWKERDEAAKKVGALKHAAQLPLQNFEVEKAVLEHAQRVGGDLGLPPDRVRTLTRLLIESALTVQERDRVRRSARDGRRALIVGGAGLMGGWFARFLEEQGYHVYVEDPRPSPYPVAPANAELDLILVATPPSHVPEALERAVARAGPTTLVADIASIKGPTVSVLRRLAQTGRRVASLHPMFGPAADVLMGRNVLVLDCGDATAVAQARSLFQHTTVRIHELPIEEHDGFMAELLGLSHAVSLVFNETLARSGLPFGRLEPLASTTFRKQVDVSREVARENPRLYYEIQSLNPGTGPMFDRIEEAVATIRRLIENGNAEGFAERMAAARSYYEEGSPRSK